jgi:mycothiol synthase
MAEDILPSGFTLRPATWTDLEAVADLIRVVCLADDDTDISRNLEDLKEYWGMPGCDISRDSCAVFSPEGRVVGYEDFYNRAQHAHLQGDGYVHPDFVGRGIGTTMLHWLEIRCREELVLADPGLRVYIRNGLGSSDKKGRELHEYEGYHAVRYFWRMEVTLTTPPVVAQFPAGVELRPFDPQSHMRKVYEVNQESFADHWGFTRIPFERWKHIRMNDTFDPTLWYVAWHKDEIAGICLCRSRSGNGWVGTLGVRRAWRNKGLGTALLLRSFSEFYQRGTPTIGLGVDAASLTGATRLYERAGMKVAHEYVSYEKELRPGRGPDEEIYQ